MGPLALRRCVASGSRVFRCNRETGVGGLGYAVPRDVKPGVGEGWPWGPWYLSGGSRGCKRWSVVFLFFVCRYLWKKGKPAFSKEQRVMRAGEKKLSVKESGLSSQS